ncbi:MAG: peptide synthetase [Microbacterium sp. 67-17]|nr:MAG: peptide synthetase [Microbacterium sp. 67-17]
MRSRKRHRRERTAGIVFASVLGAILILGVAGAAWIGIRGALAYGHVADAQRAAEKLADSLTDPAAVAAAVPTLTADTAAARSLTSDPVWGAAEHLPWFGPQLAATATVIASVDDVATTALEPLAQAASSFSLDTLRPNGGAFDVAAIANLADVATTATDSLAAASASVDAIDTTQLLPALATPVSDVSELLTDGLTAADALRRTSQLLPLALGAEGPRNYLVMFQNNAEWRSLGGIVGAMAMIHTDAGRMDLTDQGSSSDFTRYTEPVLPLSDELLGIFVDKPGLYIQNVTQIPDYTIDGPLAREMWLRETGVNVDGVFALDPVTLSYLLKATGPVTLPTGEQLTSENAVQLLLNDVYLRYPDPRDQDAFFAATAAAVFQTIADGSAEPAQLVNALVRAGNERRLFFWSANPDEQAMLDGTSLQGTLPVTDAETTAFGAYLNDGTGSKMDYYMQAASAVGWCTASSGEQLATLTVSLTSTAPADAATSLPRYITGGGSFGVDPGVARTVAYLYLPEGSELVSSTSGGVGSTPGFGQGTHDGRPVLVWETNLNPGETATATIQVRTPQTPTLEAIMTPTIGGSGVVASGGCPLTTPADKG